MNKRKCKSTLMNMYKNRGIRWCETHRLGFKNFNIRIFTAVNILTVSEVINNLNLITTVYYANSCTVVKKVLNIYLKRIFYFSDYVIYQDIIFAVFLEFLFCIKIFYFEIKFYSKRI